MKTAIVTLLLLAAPEVVGCASDANKKAQTPEQPSAAAVEQSLDDTEDAQSGQEEANAKQKTELGEKQPAATPPASDERAKAAADVTAARQLFATHAQARLQKTNTRFDEAWRKLLDAGMRVPTSVHDRVNMAVRLRSGLTDDLERLPAIDNARYPTEEKRIDARLRELDTMVDDIAAQADKLSD